MCSISRTSQAGAATCSLPDSGGQPVGSVRYLVRVVLGHSRLQRVSVSKSCWSTRPFFLSLGCKVSSTVEFQGSVAIPGKSNGFFHSSNDGAGLTWQQINERILAAPAKHGSKRDTMVQAQAGVTDFQENWVP